MVRILVPVDGSKAADRALQQAIAIAQRSGRDSEIRLFNVQEPVEEMQTHGLARDAILAHRDKLARDASVRARALLKKAGVRCSFEWRFGEPAQTIVRAARRAGCDMIVMGTRGAGALENLLLGSVAYKTLHLSKIPVTLVR